MTSTPSGTLPDTSGTTESDGSVRIDVRTEQPYPVLVGAGVAARLAEVVAGTGAGRVLVLHPPTLADRAGAARAELEAAGLAAFTHEVPDAEDGKSLASLADCWDACARAALTRADVVVGFGGGAVTDLAGFVAATWMRGVRVVHVPTTLLAMVDAAVGGKTGINTAAGKNLVGAFHEPSAVLVDLDTLRTLPRPELVAGSAEVWKAGFIADPVILDRVRADPAAALDPAGPVLGELVRRAIRVKADVVGADLRESHLREILNYGHTYGHAVEQHENYRWRHGHAVAVGMVFEAELAHAAGLLSGEAVNQHRRILQSVGLPTAYANASLEELTEVMGRDKKNKDGSLRIVVVSDDTGSYAPRTLVDPSPDDLTAAYLNTTADNSR